MEMTDTKWYLREWQKKQKNKNRKEKVRRGPFKNKNVYLSIFLRIFTIYYFLLFLFLFFVSLGWLSAISSIIFSITCFLTYTSKLSIQMKENFRRENPALLLLRAQKNCRQVYIFWSRLWQVAQSA